MEECGSATKPSEEGGGNGAEPKRTFGEKFARHEYARLWPKKLCEKPGGGAALVPTRGDSQLARVPSLNEAMDTPLMQMKRSMRFCGSAASALTPCGDASVVETLGRRITW